MKKAIILFLIFPGLLWAGHLHPEKWYQDKWCAENGGRAEVVLQDQTRCDCITGMNAVEVDFARKWYEAIGQSLYYAMLTGKRAGIVLIIESEDDMKYWNRMKATIEHFGLLVDCWRVSP
jgi:hypothetical protein